MESVEQPIIHIIKYAAVVEQADTTDFVDAQCLSSEGSTHIYDQKSVGGDIVPVQVRSAAPNIS